MPMTLRCSLSWSSPSCYRCVDFVGALQRTSSARRRNSARLSSCGSGGHGREHRDTTTHPSIKRINLSDGDVDTFDQSEQHGAVNGRAEQDGHSDHGAKSNRPRRHHDCANTPTSSPRASTWLRSAGISVSMAAPGGRSTRASSGRAIAVTRGRRRQHTATRGGRDSSSPNQQDWLHVEGGEESEQLRRRGADARMRPPTTSPSLPTGAGARNHSDRLHVDRLRHRHCSCGRRRVVAACGRAGVGSSHPWRCAGARTRCRARSRGTAGDAR